MNENYAKEAEDTTDLTANREFIISASQRVLQHGFEGIPITRVTQFVVGWTRAAFAQSLLIASLAGTDQQSSCAPNRRTFAEICVRMQWLYSLNQSERAAALDAMLEDESNLTEKFIKHLGDMGFISERDHSGMRSIVLESASGHLKDQARNFVHAAKNTNGQSVGLYYAWREETRFTHATGSLAASYAPATGRTPYPPVADKTLIAHGYSLFLIISLVYQLLIDEGIDLKVAERLVSVFLDL